MRLAFCLYKYFPYGGLQRDFVRIAQECFARGHSIDVYTMHWEGPVEPGLTIHKLAKKGLQNHTQCQNFVKQLEPLLQKQQYDRVIGFNKMPGLDIYYAADICYQAKAHKERPWWYRLTSRYQHSKAFEQAVFMRNAKTKILLLSKLQQTEFAQYYQTELERLHLLPPGIAKDRIAPLNAHEIRARVRQTYAIDEKDFLLLMVGSGFKTKGVDRTLKAYAALPDNLKKRTRIFIIGKDHAKPFELQAKLLKITPQVSFLGGRDDVPDFLLAADILIHPAYNENTGTVLLEAVAAGLPVLTTDICGYAEYIQKADAGIVVPTPFQQDTFNQTLANMLSSSNHQSWKQNGINFAKTADIYSLPQHAVSIIEAVG